MSCFGSNITSDRAPDAQMHRTGTHRQSKQWPLIMISVQAGDNIGMPRPKRCRIRDSHSHGQARLCEYV